MSTSAVTDLFAETLAYAPVLPAAFLRAAFCAATKHDDTELLRVLVAREDAPADLVIQFAALTHPQMVGIYQARFNRATQAPDAPPERRASVLGRALASITPPPEAVQAALTAFDHGPSKALADVLIKRDPGWLTAHQCVQVMLRASRATLEVERTGYTDLAARVGPALAITTLDATSALWVVRSLGMFDVPVPTLTSALQRALNRYRLSATGMWGEPEKNLRFILTEVLAARTVTDRAAMLTALQDTGTWPGYADLPTRSQHKLLFVLAQAAGTLTGAGDGRPLGWDMSPARPPQRAHAPGAMSDHELRALAASTTDPAALHDLAQQVHTSPHGQLVLVGANVLLRNPHLEIADRHALVTHVVETSAAEPGAGLLAFELSDFDPIFLFPDDEVVASAWAQAQPARVLSAHGWAPFGGREAAPQWVRRWHDQMQGPVTPAFTDVIRAVADQGLAPLEMLEFDQLSLALVWASKNAPCARAADTFAQLLARELGDDEQRWATYTVLAQTFPGTLGELLDTCRGVTAERP